jgi:hypothetical protein
MNTPGNADWMPDFEDPDYAYGRPGKLVGFDSEAMTLTLKMDRMPSAATLGERAVLILMGPPPTD